MQAQQPIADTNFAGQQGSGQFGAHEVPGPIRLFKQQLRSLHDWQFAALAVNTW